jgi:prevent-host-death family protein
MRSVGVRELRQRASEILRLVEQGESFEVTDRNRPVARLVPRAEGDVWKAMVEQGDVDEHTKELRDLPPPLRKRGRPSKALQRLRAHER